MKKYRDREDAGKTLAQALHSYANRKDVIVLALPRGGVPVGYEIAKALHAPLDVFIVRKLGMPGHEEFALGAIAMGGTILFNEAVIKEYEIPQAEIDKIIKKEYLELTRRELAYRNNRPFPKLEGKTIILVDDGVATGASIKAALKGLRSQQPAKIVVAVPVADSEIYQSILKLGYECVCPLLTDNLQAVGLWYDEFNQTEDEEVYDLMKEAQSFPL